MRRTFALVAVALASLAAAAVALLCRPLARPPPQRPRTGVLQMNAKLDREYLSESGGEAYLQIDLAATGDKAQRSRVPINAVLVLDRSGSMTGPKMDRAREAARTLVSLLGADDRLAIVDFSSEAELLLPSQPMDSDARARAQRAIDLARPMGGTNMSAAFDLAGPELAKGRAHGRIDKVFLASDGQANEGISDHDGLLRLAQADFAGATLSTFGMGEDYDEDLMTAFASQSGGRARYIASPEVLPGAFRDELSRAATATARNVRLRVDGMSPGRVLGYQTEGGWVRLPDFAAGEERRVLVKLQVPAWRGRAEVANVEVKYENAQTGEAGAWFDRVPALFTADAKLLAQPVTDVGVQGAQAEIAELAWHAARLQETGQREQAKAQLQLIRQVARPAGAQALADEYDREIAAIDGPGSAASKQVKQKAFDVARAPVAGW